jgi:hypothetical protein
MSSNKETLIYSQWFHVVMKPSRYAPVEVQDHGASYLTCPGCGTAHADIGHGDKRICGCGLHMQRWGNGLDIWK